MFMFGTVIVIPFLLDFLDYLLLEVGIWIEDLVNNIPII